MNVRYIGYSSAAFIVTIMLWIIISLLIPDGGGRIETAEDFFNSRTVNFDQQLYRFVFLFMISCITVSIYTSLYQFCRRKSPELSMLGMIFIPAYLVLSISMYAFSLAVIPILDSLHSSPSTKDLSLVLVSHFITGSGSTAMSMNSLPYTLIGIPSLIFGYVMFKMDKAVKAAGGLIFISGIGYISGIFSVFGSSNILSMVAAGGGISFIISLIIMSYLFFKPGGYSPPSSE